MVKLAGNGFIASLQPGRVGEDQMLDDQDHRKAIEDAAKVVHKSYRGVNAWSTADSAARSHARQVVRRMLAALDKNGLRLTAGAPESAQLPTSRAALPTEKPKPDDDDILLF